MKRLGRVCLRGEMTYWEELASKQTTEQLRRDMTFDPIPGYRHACAKELEAREAMQQAKEEEKEKERTFEKTDDHMPLQKGHQGEDT